MGRDLSGPIRALALRIKALGANTASLWALFTVGTILGLVGFGNLTSTGTVSFGSVVMAAAGSAAIILLILRKSGAILAASLVVLLVFSIDAFNIVLNGYTNLHDSQLDNVSAAITLTLIILFCIYLVKLKKQYRIEHPTVSDIKTFGALAMYWVLLIAGFVLAIMGFPTKPYQTEPMSSADIAMTAAGFVILIFLILRRPGIIRIIGLASFLLASTILLFIILKNNLGVLSPRLEIITGIFLQIVIYFTDAYLITRQKYARTVGALLALPLIIASLYAMLNVTAKSLLQSPQDFWLISLFAVFPLAFGIFLITRPGIALRLLGVVAIIFALIALFIAMVLFVGISRGTIAL